MNTFISLEISKSSFSDPLIENSLWTGSKEEGYIEKGSISSMAIRIEFFMRFHQLHQVPSTVSEMFLIMRRNVFYDIIERIIFFRRKITFLSRRVRFKLAKNIRILDNNNNSR